MADIEIIKINETYVYVKTDGGVAAEISDFFKFRPPGFQFMPAYKAKRWDGFIRLFDVFDRKLPMGLLPRLISFCKNYNYDVDVDIELANKKVPVDEEIVTDFCKMLKLTSKGKQITPYTEQISAILEAILSRRAVLLSPTASGKSLIQYALIRWYQMMSSTKKILLIVPTTSLVEQMYSDFDDYSSALTDWDVENNCHKIYSGKEKETDCQVIISTWQSIYKLGPKFFNQFTVILGDECHLFKAQSLTKIMEKAINAKYRIGLTGTIDDKTVHKLQLEGSFGPIKRVATTHDLQQKGQLSKIAIKCIKLVYSDADKKHVKGMTYQEEMKWSQENAQRNQVLINLALAQAKRPNKQGNTLLLFNKISHGDELFEAIKAQAKDDQKVFFVSGRVKAEDREAIRHAMMEDHNTIIVASYGTFSTGVNIPNINCIILGASSKSEIRVLQSIGRGLRLAKGKSHMILYDVYDDLVWKKAENYGSKHFTERLNIYVREKFEYMIHRIDMK